MKKQIRYGVFETNSSSTHSLTMCSKDDFDKWKNGELFLFNGYNGFYFENNRPTEGHFYTLEEAIKFEKNNKYVDKDFDWEDNACVIDLLHENQWYDYDYYVHCCRYYEEFEAEYITSSGEQIIAFGYYGVD